MNRLLAAIALILCVSGIASSQTMMPCMTYTLTGTVVIAAHGYPDFIEVLLLSDKGEQVIEHTNLDSTNRFSMSNLPEGRFDVVIRLDGFKEMREQVRLLQTPGIQPPDTTSTECTITGTYWLLPSDITVVADERLRGYPREAIDEYGLAIAADSDKRLEEVVKHLERVVKLAADWLDAHCELGAAYEKVHRTADAETQYRAALELKPDSFRALMSLGRLYVFEADEKIQDPASHDAVRPILDHAHETLASAIERDPMSAMASYLLGTVDFRLAAYASAETELNRALELNAEMFPARIMLINVYIEQKRWQDALDSADTFIIENPTSPYRSQVTATRTSILRRLQAPR